MKKVSVLRQWADKIDLLNHKNLLYHCLFKTVSMKNKRYKLPVNPDFNKLGQLRILMLLKFAWLQYYAFVIIKTSLELKLMSRLLKYCQKGLLFGTKY